MKNLSANLLYHLAITLVTALTVSGSSGAAEPTEYEQYMLELINRARADPNGEVTRANQLYATQPGYWGSFTGFNSYGPFRGPAALNEGPPTLGGTAYTIPATPKQPLAFNTRMMDATRQYVALMQTRDSISHSIDGTTVDDRLASNGYNTGLALQSGQNNYYPGSENNSFAATSESWDTARYPGDIRKEAIALMHQLLFTDAAAASRGHRMTMLASDWRESGIAFNFGTDGNFSSVYANHAFGVQSASGPFITGVAYNDLDADKFFTPHAGEALASLEITVYKAGTQSIVARRAAFVTGGYALEVPANGTYDVRFVGRNIDQTFTGVAVANENVKVDAINPIYRPTMPGPASGFAVSSIVLAGYNVSITWNSIPGIRYQLHSSTDLKSWSTIGSAIAATGSTNSFTHDNGALGTRRRYYRVEQLR